MSLPKVTKNFLLVCIGVSLIAFGAWGLLKRYKTTHNPAPTISSEVVTYSTDSPDETQPNNACETYQTVAHEPRKIELPSIQTSGCIQKVGIDQNNAITAPNNIHLAGWYVNSPPPGKKGVSIIDGHVSGRYENGVFKKLVKLVPGDSIKIQMGDMSWREFEVSQTDSYPANQVMSQLSKINNDGSTQLALITCDGRFDAQTQTYENRVLVRATLKE